MISLSKLTPHIEDVENVYKTKLTPLKAEYFAAKLRVNLEVAAAPNAGLMDGTQLTEVLASQIYNAECSSNAEQGDALVIADAMKGFAKKSGLEKQVAAFAKTKRKQLTEDTILKAKNIAASIWKLHEQNYALHKKHDKTLLHDIPALFTYVDVTLAIRSGDPNFDLVGALAQDMYNVNPLSVKDTYMQLGMEALAKEYGIENQVYAKYRELMKAKSEKEK